MLIEHYMLSFSYILKEEVNELKIPLKNFFEKCQWFLVKSGSLIIDP